MENLLDGAPYADKGMGKRKLVDEDHLMLMQIALKPGQSVPKHKATFVVIKTPNPGQMDK
jgi:hypothetical protein